MPTLDEVDQAGMDAIWLVLQHGDHFTQKKYFPTLEKPAENGDLRMAQIAMMKDRILMSAKSSNKGYENPGENRSWS